MTEFRSYPKPTPKPKKVFGVKYWSNIRTKSVKKKLDNAKEFLAELKLWHHRLHDRCHGICAESGMNLRFNKGHCCHLLPKSMYENFSFDDRNGILLAMQYHNVLDHGSPKQRK